MARAERGGFRREQILGVALRLFADKGIAGTGLRQIAQEVGIAQPALYHYFRSKDELVDAVIEWRAELMAERFPASTFDPPKTQTLREGLHEYLQHFHRNWADRDNEAIHRVILAELVRGSPVAAKLQEQFIRPQLERVERLFANLAANGKIRDLSPHFLALQFVAPLIFATMAMGSKGHAHPGLQQFVFQHLEVFIRGIETR